MNHEIANQTGLSIDQRKLLVETISDQFGHGLSFNEFTYQVLMLFEDIPGFVMLSDSESPTLINQLWSHYHGPDK